MHTAAVTPITTESIQVDLNMTTTAEISIFFDACPQYMETPDPRQSTPIPVSVSFKLTENMTPRVAKTADITGFPTLTLLATTDTSTELSTTPTVPGTLLY